LTLTLVWDDHENSKALTIVFDCPPVSLFTTNKGKTCKHAWKCYGREELDAFTKT
jgi:hypothetical protein